jgi:enterochelin esterase-like enzyme
MTPTTALPPAIAFRTLEVSDPSLLPDGLAFVTVKSPALGARADLTLFVPEAARGRRGVPLVVLLHGAYGSHWHWAFQGGAHRTLARLVAEGRVPPMVLAMPSDGLRGDGSGYVRHDDGMDVERWIVDDVPAAAARVAPMVDAGSPCFLAGLSMGGFGALRLAGRHPARFAGVAAHSAVTDAARFDDLLEERRRGWPGSTTDTGVLASLVEAKRAGAALPPLRFDCGRDDSLVQGNRDLHAALRDAAIAHTYEEHAGAHDWAYWSRHIEETLVFFGALVDPN